MKYLHQFVTTFLNVGGGINASQTTGIVLQSLNNVDATKPSVACVTWADPLDTSVAEWITYTSINSTTNELQGVVRGAEGYSAKTHGNQAVVAFPLSKAHVNELNDAFLSNHASTGNLKSGAQINDTTADHQYVLAVSELTADRTITLPLLTASDEFVFQSHGLTSSANANFTYTGVARQAIINGNFPVWQRGTSFVGTALGGIASHLFGYEADRWYSQAYCGSTGSGTFTLTVSRQTFTLGQTDVPNNPKYFHRFALSGLATEGGTGALLRTLQRIEGVDKFAGTTVTLTAWIKADGNRTFGVGGTQVFGTGGSPSASVPIAVQSINVTSSWQKFTLNFAVPSISGKTLGTAGDDFVEFIINYYSQGSVGTFATGTFDIAQVQLCAGSVALPFQAKSFEDELRACQRYYEKSYNYATAIGAAESSGRAIMPMSTCAAATTFRVWIPFKVKKRTTSPTVTFYGPVAGTSGKAHCYDGADREVNCTTTEVGMSGVYSAITTPNNAGAATVFISAHYTASDEL